VKSLRSAIDQTLFPKPLKETPEFSLRWAPLLEIHEMDSNAAFFEEALRFSNVGVFFHAKDLNFHSVYDNNLIDGTACATRPRREELQLIGLAPPQLL
tara:strand:- start:476 stop:769 length:294 start_codon:yes stop_codon:yes gene_type:complete